MVVLLFFVLIAAARFCTALGGWRAAMGLWCPANRASRARSGLEARLRLEPSLLLNLLLGSATTLGKFVGSATVS